MAMAMSPCQPSKLHLGETLKTQPKDLSQQRDLASSNKMQTKPQNLTCGKEERKSNQEQHCDISNERAKVDITPYGSTSSSFPHPKISVSDSTEIINKSLYTDKYGPTRKRYIKDSQDLTSRTKYSAHEGEFSSISKNSVQNKICFTETSPVSSSMATNSCMESFVDEKDRMRSDADLNTEHRFSKTKEEDFIVKPKHDVDKKNKNRKTFASLFENRVRIQNVCNNVSAGAATSKVTPEKVGTKQYNLTEVVKRYFQTMFVQNEI